MGAPKGPRPITRALMVAKAAEERIVNDTHEHVFTADQYADLLASLDAIDASSTHQDTGRRRKARRKATATKSARKSRSPGAKKAAFDQANE